MSVSLSNLTMEFGGITALDVGDLEITSGRSTVLVGPNGAGKSTLLLILAGLLRPTSGTASIFGSPPGSAHALATLSFAPDQPALFDDLTLGDQLTYIARLHKADVQTLVCQRLITALDAQDLLSKFPRAMSKGQRQKASLLVATARPFEVLLLDEPTTALDSESRQALVHAVAALAATGITLISSTHDPEFIDAADTEVRLDRGRVSTGRTEDAPSDDEE